MQETIKDISQHLTMLESELFYALKAIKRRLAKKQELEEGTAKEAAEIVEN